MKGLDEASTIEQISAMMTGAEVLHLTKVQDLWSGYGAIYRVVL